MTKEKKTQAPDGERKCDGIHETVRVLKREINLVQNAVLATAQRVERINSNSKSRDSVNYHKLLDKINELGEAVGNSLDAIANQTYNVDVKVKPLSPDAKVPTYASDGSAGLDFTAVNADFDKETQTILYHTGWAVEIPMGYVGLLFPKSGIYKKTMRLTNNVGILDSDYRGEVCARFENNTNAFLHNLDEDRFFKRFGKTNRKDYVPGDAIIQLVVVPIPRVNILVAEELSETERGESGFGDMDARTTSCQVSHEANNCITTKKVDHEWTTLKS